MAETANWAALPDCLRCGSNAYWVWDADDAYWTCDGDGNALYPAEEDREIGAYQQAEMDA